MEHLPEEILLGTFALAVGGGGNFNVNTALGLLRVSRRWRRVALDHSLWRAPVSLRCAVVLANAVPRDDSAMALPLNVREGSSSDCTVLLRDASRRGFDITRLGPAMACLQFASANKRDSYNIVALLTNFSNGSIPRLARFELGFAIMNDVKALCKALAHCIALQHVRMTLGVLQSVEMQRLFALPLDLITLAVEIKMMPGDRDTEVTISLKEATQVTLSLEEYEETRTGETRASCDIIHVRGFFAAQRFPRLRKLTTIGRDTEKQLFEDAPPLGLCHFAGLIEGHPLRANYPQASEVTLFESHHSPSGPLHLASFPSLRSLKYTIIDPASLSPVRTLLEQCVSTNHPLTSLVLSDWSLARISRAAGGPVWPRVFPEVPVLC